MADQEVVEKPKSEIAKKRGAPKKEIQADSSNVVPIRGGAMPIEVLSVDEAYANKVHLKILELMHTYEETYFKLAEALYEVKQTQLYRHLKYETFEKYVESIGVDVFKAQRLMRVWWWFGIEQNKNPKLLDGAQKVGWTKAYELVGVIDGRNASRWFRLANDMNAKDLGKAARVAKKAAKEAAEERAREEKKAESKKREEEARASYLGGGDEVTEEEPNETPEAMKTLDPKRPKTAAVAHPEPPTPGAGSVVSSGADGIDPPDDVEAEIEALKKESDNWKNIRFGVPLDCWDSVTQAIALAKSLGETESDNVAFTLICLHYLSFHDEKSVVLGEWLARIERLTGMSLVAIDKRTREISYGAELIDELAKEGEGDAGEQGDGNRGDGGSDQATQEVD